MHSQIKSHRFCFGVYSSLFLQEAPDKLQLVPPDAPVASCAPHVDSLHASVTCNALNITCSNAYNFEFNMSA